jgi:NAD(P)-dependent dehydrogenase (short-subunit alcohol dehydrogenase family)
MSGRFTGKVALVTGAASGIGRAIALQLAAEGARLVVTTRQNQRGLDETVELVRAGGSVARGIVADAASAGDTRMAVQRAVEAFDRLDVLVANAAHLTPRHLLADTSEELWQRTIDVGLKGVYLAAQAAVPFMIETAGHGAIVNVSSINSTFHVPGLVAYSASKGGVDALTRQLAVELGPSGIRVNAVNPGLIAVETVVQFLDANPSEAQAAREVCPLDRIGTPGDVAMTVAFLASDDASFITGVTVPVDGGSSVQSPAALLRPGLRRGWRDGTWQRVPDSGSMQRDRSQP